ncbi:MAG: MBL fold metallo-hydrolase [Acidobacteria bacterium]|nr:MBL fold metallo-hydrolase [Acidobacteriota bacterium]
MALTLTLFALPVLADNPETAAEVSQERARNVLNAALGAIGGRAALEAVENVSYTLSGPNTPRLQTTTVDPPYKPGFFEEKAILDVKGNRIRADQRGDGAGFVFQGRVLVGGGEGHNLDLINHFITKMPNITGPQVGQYSRRLPSEILRMADQRALTLRWLGEDTFDGRKQNAITFVHTDSTQLAVYVDAQTNLVSKYEIVYADTLTETEASEIIFSDYRPVNGVQFPTRWRFRQAGQPVADYIVSDVKLNAKLDDAAFAKPTDFLESPPFPQGRTATVSKLADDVFLVRDVGGGGYHVLAVAFPDYILVVEAPLNAGAAQGAIAKIKETIPNKPIRYFAVTHHHNDHSGGARAFLAEKATLVTTAGNRKLFYELGTANHRDVLGKTPPKPSIEVIEGVRRGFKSGDQVVELINIGPNPHADEMVIAYLPKQKILFQGDLFSPPESGPIGKAQAGTVHLAQKIRELGLQVDQVIGVHGRASTLAELEKNVAESKGSN